MDNKLTSFLFPLLVLLILSGNAFAQGEESPDLTTRVEHYYATYYVNEDASYVHTYGWAEKVLKDGAIENVKKASIAYSASLQRAEVLEAYTRKADGRRLDSPKSNFQVEVNSGRGKDAPIFSDITTLTVVFPDVAVGDTVVFSCKVITIEPMFPKHFSVEEVFPKIYAYDDVRIRVDMPASLWGQYGARQFNETVTEKGGRKIIEWTYSNKDPIKNDRRNYSVYDTEQEPGFAVSTFRTYAEIAEAYGVRAHSKALVTGRIQKLADEITKDKKTKRDQAKGLYDWVATNITYAGNCIGMGAVVPHDIPFVLDNKMGDCKDHATLLQALLIAKDIPNTQALLNAGRSYRLPGIPVVSTVNHVINYIPDLDLYADSTASATPFGMLPFQDADKPVLLVDGYKDGIKTPILPLGANQQKMKTIVNINPDGSITADVEVAMKGMFAVGSRFRFRHMAKEQEDKLVQDVLKSIGYIGTGSFEKEDPTALMDTYQYKAKFEMREFVRRPGAGAFAINPLFFSEAPINRFLIEVLEPEETVDVFCTSGSTVEEYVYHFPKGMIILSSPENMSLDNGLLSYRATYRVKDDTLTVERILEDKTHGNVCSPAVISAYNKLASKALQNVKEQVIYK